MIKRFFFFLLFLGVAYISNAQAQYENTKINIGQKAPELAFLNPAGDTIRLSDINKHRIILLDFWASWCGPCRRASPEVVALYKKYHDKKFRHAKKGFEVVSVSLDQHKEPWLQAIKADSLYWPYHMSDLGGWRSMPANLYGVEFIPQSFLIDENGNVLGKYQVIGQAAADIEKLYQEEAKKKHFLFF